MNVAPAATTSSAALGVRFHTHTLCPALSKFNAMGLPMMPPAPMSPTVFGDGDALMATTTSERVRVRAHHLDAVDERRRALCDTNDDDDDDDVWQNADVAHMRVKRNDVRSSLEQEHDARRWIIFVRVRRAYRRDDNK
jgi:hypothetical protein